MSELKELIIAYNMEVKAALQSIVNALNQGQRKKLLKNAAAAAMLKRYGVKMDN